MSIEIGKPLKTEIQSYLYRSLQHEVVIHIFLFDVLLVLASTNLFFGVGSFAPLPSIDGWVIWREVIALLRSRFAERAA